MAIVIAVSREHRHTRGSRSRPLSTDHGARRSWIGYLSCRSHRLHLPPTPMTSAANSTPLLERITLNPLQCGGRPCIRGMRIRVIDVLELLAAGETHEQLLADYPYLESDDIAASLLYAARRLDHPHLAA